MPRKPTKRQVASRAAATRAQARKPRNAELTKFRATLAPAGSDLNICPPGCKVDHDNVAAHKDPAPTTAVRVANPDKEDIIMAKSTQVKPLSKAAATKAEAAGEKVYRTADGAAFSSRQARRAYRKQQAAS